MLRHSLALLGRIQRLVQGRICMLMLAYCHNWLSRTELLKGLFTVARQDLLLSYPLVAGDHLATAWARAYAISTLILLGPYGESINAVEAAAHAIVEPNNTVRPGGGG